MDSERDPAQALTDLASEERAELIVVGDEDFGFVLRVLLGSTAEKVPRQHRATCWWCADRRADAAQTPCRSRGAPGSIRSMARSMLTAQVGRLPSRLVGRVMTRFRAWRYEPRIDSALAGGTDPWRSGELFLRAVHLAARDERRRLADAIEQLVTRAKDGRQGRPYRRLRRRQPASPYPTLRRREILAHRNGLMALAARIGAPAPVPVSVVARLMLLLCAGSSPIFVGGRPVEEMTTTVHECLQALEQGFSEESLAP